MIVATQDQGVDLYFNDSKKAETETYGFNVSGTTQSSALRVTGVSTFVGNVELDSTLTDVYGNTGVELRFLYLLDRV